MVQLMQAYTLPRTVHYKFSLCKSRDWYVHLLIKFGELTQQTIIDNMSCMLLYGYWDLSALCYLVFDTELASYIH